MGVPVWLQDLSAIGTVAAGLALLLAFVQLGALRRDRLRDQVDKVAAWLEKLERLEKEQGEVSWVLPVRVRNGSELPVTVDSVVMNVHPLAYNLEWAAAPEGERKLPGPHPRKVQGKLFRMDVRPGVIAPDRTWTDDPKYHQPHLAEYPQAPEVAIARMVVTDAAGRQWKITPARGPAQRVHRRRRQEN